MSLLREKILVAASDLFQTRGINSTGVDTIVATAGTTKMTLYKYFRSKEDLIAAVLQKAYRDFQDWLAERLASTKKPSDKLQNLFDFIEEWVNAPDFRGMAFLKASAEFPDADNPIHRLSAALSLEFRRYLATLATEAGVADADGLSLQLSLLIEGAMQAEQIQRGSGSMQYAKKASRILIDSALKG